MQQRRILVALAAMIAAAAAGCNETVPADSAPAGSAPASPEFGGDLVGRIAYDASTPTAGDRDLFLLETVTGSIRALTRTAATAERAPTVDPAGSVIAYAATSVGLGDREVSSELRVHELLPSGEVGEGFAFALAQGPRSLCTLSDPVLGPDGERLAFRDMFPGAQPTGDDAPGGTGVPPSSATRLAMLDGSAAIALDAESLGWSPDGTRAALVSVGRLWVVDLSRSPRPPIGVEPIADLAADPEWAPEGELIAFAQGEPGARRIALVDAGAGEMRELAPDLPGDQIQPSWSPDGRWIALAAGTAASHDLYAVAVATGEIVRLTESAADEQNPTWLPHAARGGLPARPPAPLGSLAGCRHAGLTYAPEPVAVAVARSISAAIDGATVSGHVTVLDEPFAGVCTEGVAVELRSGQQGRYSRQRAVTRSSAGGGYQLRLPERAARSWVAVRRERHLHGLALVEVECGPSRSATFTPVP